MKSWIIDCSSCCLSLDYSIPRARGIKSCPVIIFELVLVIFTRRVFIIMHNHVHVLISIAVMELTFVLKDVKMEMIINSSWWSARFRHIDRTYTELILRWSVIFVCKLLGYLLILTRFSIINSVPTFSFWINFHIFGFFSANLDIWIFF
jgi:hypothetical protein